LRLYSHKEIERIDQTYHLFSEIASEERWREHHQFQFSAKDNLCTMDMQTRAGSRILDGYRPPFDATALARLRVEGGLLVGKANMDEFGFGSFSTNSAYGVPLNPFDRDRCCGGSSGGSAAAACLLEDHLSVGESTGGSIACPAAFCGVFGFTPTYGRVSRYGLVDYANSLDKIGLLSRSARQIARFLPVIAGPDPMDPTSQAQPALSMDGGKGGSVAVPLEAMKGLEASILDSFQSSMGRLEDMGMTVSEVSIPSMRFALPAYYILATSESSTNLARYCGMRFGTASEEFYKNFNEFFSGVRSKEFGKEAKRRILLGTFCRMVGFRERYYMKALHVRELMKIEYARIFKEHDLIATPTMPFVAPRFSEVEKMSPLDMYKADFLTVPPNLTGLPHVSMPSGYLGGMPLGLQMTAPHWEEGALVRMMLRWEDEFKPSFQEV
jgi:aspartyl-tRNA(Asn)/glutamyl-tRNA(Gln) amidotransferase subunit A